MARAAFVEGSVVVVIVALQPVVVVHETVTPASGKLVEASLTVPLTLAAFPSVNVCCAVRPDGLPTAVAVKVTPKSC